MKPKFLILLIPLILLTFFSRFVNLNWDRGFGFHPDENNLWGASRNIKLFSQTDPQFYAYGGFPIYLYSLLPNKVTARAISALCQILIVFLLFLIGKQLIPPKSSKSLNSPTFLYFFCALLAVFSAGLIQAAHFLTVESLIGLFGLLVVYFLLAAYNNYKNYKFYKIYIVLAAISFGLGLATKISFITFALPFLPVFFGRTRPNPPLSRSSSRERIVPKRLEVRLGGLTLIPLFIFFLFNPSIFTNFNSFKSTLLYESNIATGQTPVFYTRQFTDTISGLFQVTNIFPFIEGWAFVPLFIIGVILLCCQILCHSGPSVDGAGIYKKIYVDSRFPACLQARRGNDKQKLLIILLAVISAILSFIPFSAKWTRYVVQVLPILIIPAALTLSALWQKGRLCRALSLLSLLSLLPPFSHALAVYLHPDTRLAAADWAETNLPHGSKIFSESYDLGILPFNPKFQNNITLFNFYELDSPSEALAKEGKLDTLIQESDYFISVSQRVYANSLAHPDRFPASAAFYHDLFNGSLGYQKVYESLMFVIPAPCLQAGRKAGIYINNSRGITKFSSPEETFSVFDHPTVTIFKKL